MILVTWDGVSVSDCVAVVPMEGRSVSDCYCNGYGRLQ